MMSRCCQAGLLCLQLNGGGKETRTPDIKLAKLALYQLSYTPGWPAVDRLDALEEEVKTSLHAAHHINARTKVQGLSTSAYRAVRLSVST